MIIKTEEYQVDCSENRKAVLSGVLRLPSPTSYEQPFSVIKQNIEEAATDYTVDLVGLSFLNSSGITALARLIILARTFDVPIYLIINDNIPWQKKSISSLKNLWERIQITSIKQNDN
jgi:hypothetical protein